MNKMVRNMISDGRIGVVSFRGSIKLFGAKRVCWVQGNTLGVELGSPGEVGAVLSHLTEISDESTHDDTEITPEVDRGGGSPAGPVDPPLLSSSTVLNTRQEPLQTLETPGDAVTYAVPVPVPVVLPVPVPVALPVDPLPVVSSDPAGSQEPMPAPSPVPVAATVIAPVPESPPIPVQPAPVGDVRQEFDLEKLRSCKNLRSILDLLRQWGWTEEKALVAKCQELKDAVPFLSRVTDIPMRVHLLRASGR